MDEWEEERLQVLWLRRARNECKGKNILRNIPLTRGKVEVYSRKGPRSVVSVLERRESAQDLYVAMYSSHSSQREFSATCMGDDHPSKSDFNVQDPKNRTAIDAAVVENMTRANIHELADSLRSEGSRENFMEWL